MARTCARRRYGFGQFVFDFVLTILTGGLWLLWLIIRFLRNNA